MEETVTTAIHQIDELLDAKNTTITTYNNDEFIGVRFLTIPLEDFLYNLVLEPLIDYLASIE